MRVHVRRRRLVQLPEFQSGRQAALRTTFRRSDLHRERLRLGLFGRDDTLRQTQRDAGLASPVRAAPPFRHRDHPEHEIVQKNAQPRLLLLFFLLPAVGVFVHVRADERVRRRLHVDDLSTARLRPLDLHTNGDDFRVFHQGIFHQIHVQILSRCHKRATVALRREKPKFRRGRAQNRRANARRCTRTVHKRHPQISQRHRAEPDDLHLVPGSEPARLVAADGRESDREHLRAGLGLVGGHFQFVHCHGRVSHVFYDFRRHLSAALRRGRGTCGE